MYHLSSYVNQSTEKEVSMNQIVFYVVLIPWQTKGHTVTSHSVLESFTHEFNRGSVLYVLFCATFVTIYDD